MPPVIVTPVPIAAGGVVDNTVAIIVTGGYVTVTYEIIRRQTPLPPSLPPVPPPDITIGTPDASYTALNTAVAAGDVTIAQTSVTVDGSITLPHGATAVVHRSARTISIGINGSGQDTPQYAPQVLRVGVGGNASHSLTREITVHADFPVATMYGQTVTVAAANSKTFVLPNGSTNHRVSLLVRAYNYNVANINVNVTPQQLSFRANINGGNNQSRTTQNRLFLRNFGSQQDPTRWMILESDYAGYAMSFRSTANFFHFGFDAPADAAALYGAHALHARYLIPIHNVKGFLGIRASVHNSRFLSNKEVGTLGVDFGAARATLNLKVHGYDNISYGNALLTSTEQFGSVVAEFDDFVLPNFSGSSADNSNCVAGGGSDATTLCAGTLNIWDGGSAASLVAANSANTNGAVKVAVGFYGSSAQQIAGYARYVNGDNYMHLGFVGAHTGGGVNPAAVLRSAGIAHTALRWDRASPSPARGHLVTVNSSGAPVAYRVSTVPGATTAHNFGAAAGTQNSYHYFRNTLAVVFRADASAVMQVGSQSFGVSNVGSGASGITFAAKAYRRVDTSGSAPNVVRTTTFSQVVGAQHAAFFYMVGQDLREAHHGIYGAQTPLWIVNLLRASNLNATYTIPVGAAQGVFWNQTDASDLNHREFLLYNKQGGELKVGFGPGLATLHLTVGSVAPGGAYAEDFLNIAGFEMTIVGDTFNNYGCYVAGGSRLTSAADCGGTLDYAARAGVADQALNLTAGPPVVRVIAGGAFYGASAQEAGGGIAHLFGNSARTNGGMRLQWIGANTGAGVDTSVSTLAITLAPLPEGSIPGADLSTDPIPTPGNLVTAHFVVVTASVIGARHTAVYGTAQNVHAHVSVNRSTADVTNFFHYGDNTYNITDTITAGTVSFDLNGNQFNRRASIMVTLFRNFPVSTHTPDVELEDGNNEFFTFAPRAGGSLGWVANLYVYNALDHTLDITPQAPALRYAVRGVTATVTPRLSLAWWDTGARDYVAVESDYAAYAIRNITGGGSSYGVWRYGVLTPNANLAALIAAGVQGSYLIPRHAAKGAYHVVSGAGDAAFLSNKETGTLAVDFGADRATLNLVVNAYTATIFGNDGVTAAADVPTPTIFAIKDFVLSLTLTTGGYAYNNFACASHKSGGSTDATNCGGAVVLHGREYPNDAAGGRITGIDVRFYGDRAQQIAGAVEYRRFFDRVSIAFLGMRAGGNAGGVTLSARAASFRALKDFTADSNLANDMTVLVTTGGAPVSLGINSSTTVAFGARVSTTVRRYAFRYFENTVGAVLFADEDGFAVNNTTLIVRNLVSVGTGGAAGYTVSFSSHSHYGVSGAVTTFAQVVEADHAAFFVLSDTPDIRRARHGFYGAQTPLWVADMLEGASLKADYLIPVGGAQGLFWHRAAFQWADGRYLYNRVPGKLEADFGAARVKLSLDVDGANVGGNFGHRGGSQNPYLRIANFGMTIIGNTFNNYHCYAAGGDSTSATDCPGTFTFSPSALLQAYRGHQRQTGFNASHRIIAGGGFYGDGAQEVAGGIGFYGGSFGRFGMRLQFVGADPKTPGLP